MVPGPGRDDDCAHRGEQADLGIQRELHPEIQALAPIRAVTFDFFQTLVQHRAGRGGRGRALVAYLTSVGLELKPWEHRMLYDVFEPHAREYAPDLEDDVKRAYLVRLARRVLERVAMTADGHDPAQHADTIWQLIGPAGFEPYDDVIGVLHDLRRDGYRLAVVSNWHCGLAHFAAELGLARYFDEILVSAEVGHAKPAREIFHAAADRLGLGPGEILHVGDTPSEDYEGARAAGFSAVLLDREGAAAEAASVQPVIRSLLELPRLV